MPDTFKCDYCGGTFTSSDPTGATAEAEAIANWGHSPQGDDRKVLCDDCYEEFKAWFHTHSDRRLA